MQYRLPTHCHLLIISLLLCARVDTQSPSIEGLSLADLPPVENEDLLRSVKYTFPSQFLKFNTVRTA